ncbi:sugar ABC transporter ATP-binding protein [Paenarthrobacter nicotinovorans]|uniref:sugar ABC transporter ATP-binding protein n=1 Tax=Paenarthrobacter nicotinovorans TaxID=29320 RepID=UPI0038204DEA
MTHNATSSPGLAPRPAIGAQKNIVAALRGVTKRFGGVAAIENVDVEFAAGSVHALVGENGAGKSTLMKVLTGLYRPDEGHVEVDGTPWTFASVFEAEEAGIALIPQELELFEELSVAENMYVGRKRPRTKFGLFDHRVMEKKASELLAWLGAPVDPSTPVKFLPSSTRQLVEIGRALLRDARLVVMDEPTSSLSERETERLSAIVRQLASAGTSVVYISHRMHEIYDLSDQITVLRDGRRIGSAPTQQLPGEELVKMMVGRPLSMLYHREHQPIGEPILEVRGLSKAGEYQDISFTVHRGEVLALAGLVGAGRTEVAHAITGVTPAESGEIILRGETVKPRSPKSAHDLGISHVPEERRAQGVVLPLSIERNIGLGNLGIISRLGWVSNRKERSLGREFVQKLTVRGGDPAHPIHGLSGGNQQKIVVAKALAQNPDVLVLDEPTRGVDIGAKAEIYGIIDKLAAEGRAILLISSELVEVLTMADRIIVLREGRAVAEFDAAEATQELVVQAASGSSRAEDVANEIPDAMLAGITRTNEQPRGIETDSRPAVEKEGER